MQEGNITMKFRSPVDARDIHVSSLDSGGIPAGNDSTGNGTQAEPYLTLAAGYATVAAGDRVLLNGDPASPASYVTSGETVLDRDVTVKAVNHLGAILTGSGAGSAVTVSPAISICCSPAASTFKTPRLP